MKVYIGINTYACGEFLFVSRTLELAKFAMTERYGQVVVGWDVEEEKYAVYSCGSLVGYIIENNI